MSKSEWRINDEYSNDEVMNKSLTEQINITDQEPDATVEEGKLLDAWPAEELLAATLAGLAGRDEELARVIGAVEIPDEVEPAAARDGSVSFRLRQPDGRRRWLGWGNRE